MQSLALWLACLKLGLVLSLQHLFQRVQADFVSTQGHLLATSAVLNVPESDGTGWSEYEVLADRGPNDAWQIVQEDTLKYHLTGGWSSEVATFSGAQCAVYSIIDLADSSCIPSRAAIWLHDVDAWRAPSNETRSIVTGVGPGVVPTSVRHGISAPLTVGLQPASTYQLRLGNNNDDPCDFTFTLHTYLPGAAGCINQTDPELARMPLPANMQRLPPGPYANATVAAREIELYNSNYDYYDTHSGSNWYRVGAFTKTSCVALGVYSPTEPQNNSALYAISLSPSSTYLGALSNRNRAFDQEMFISGILDQCNGITCNATVAWSDFHPVQEDKVYWVFVEPASALNSGSHGYQYAYYFWQALSAEQCNQKSQPITQDKALNSSSIGRPASSHSTAVIVGIVGAVLAATLAAVAACIVMRHRRVRADYAHIHDADSQGGEYGEYSPELPMEVVPGFHSPQNTSTFTTPSKSAKDFSHSDTMTGQPGSTCDSPASCQSGLSSLPEAQLHHHEESGEPYSAEGITSLKNENGPL